MNNSISVFIPVYNSESWIEKTIIQSYDFLSSSLLDFELIVVDDSSTDNTTVVIEKLLIDRPLMSLVRCSNGPSRRENLGKAMYEKSQKDIIFYMDADMAVPIENILVFVKEMDERNGDLCLASRYIGIKPQRTLYRLVISRLFNFFIQVVFQSKVKDHICGFKAFKKEKYDILYPMVGYDNTMKRGWFWDAEIVIKSQRCSMKIVELPVQWNAGDESTFNLKREIKLLSYIVKRYKKITK